MVNKVITLYFDLGECIFRGKAAGKRVCPINLLIPIQRVEHESRISCRDC
jgi:hypothetical protein